MKKLRFLPLLLSLTLFFSACGSKTEALLPQEAFTPLFRFSISSLEQNKTRIFYLPKSDGFLYLHGQTGGGFIAGFVSPEKSISCESVVKNATPLTFATVRDTGENTANLLTDGGISLALLKENTSQTTPLPEKVDFKRAVFYDDLTVIGETEELLVLCPVDLQSTYVLTPKEALPDFDGVIGVSHAGQRIWFARGRADGTWKGIAFFEYGSTTPMGALNFTFDAFTPIGKTSVLFTDKQYEAPTLYSLRNLENDQVKSVLVEDDLEGVTCDPSGKYLCGTLKKENGGEVRIYEFASGELLGSYEIPNGTPSPYLAISDDAKTLLFAVSQGNDEIIASLDLDKM